MKYGFLNYYPTADKRDPLASIFAGTINVSPLMGGAVQLRPNVDGEGDRAPQYVVFYKPGTDRPWQEMGAAWTKQRNDESGEFLSLTLDFPTWDSPLNLSAFPGESKDQPWNVVWRRKRGGNGEEG